MECVSISYKSAAESIRKLFSFTEEEKEDLKVEFPCVILDTCNRIEIYTSRKNSFSLLERILSKKANIQETEVKKYIRRFQGKDAVKHLCKVTCGLDSMVIGENEILGQVRRAYILSSRLGLADSELDILFNSALYCAKKIKTDTNLSKCALSIATIASKKIIDFIGDVKSKRTGISALLIGASGKMGNIILKKLLEEEDIKIFATKRTHGFIQENNNKVDTIDYAARYQYLDVADIVISATESPHYTITKGEALKYIKTDKTRMFVDIAVPSDIDDAIRNIQNCSLIDIDDFEQLSKENNKKKQKAILDANSLIDRELDYISNKIAL